MSPEAHRGNSLTDYSPISTNSSPPPTKTKNGKPAPDPYLAGLRKAGNLAPHEGIVIENAPLGIQAGTNAGCFTIAVNSGPLSNEILLEKNPQLLYPSIEKLFVDWPTLIAEAKYKQTDKMNIKKTQ